MEQNAEITEFLRDLMGHCSAPGGNTGCRMNQKRAGDTKPTHEIVHTIANQHQQG